MLFRKKWKKEETKLPLIKILQNLPQPPMFTTNDHNQPPVLENEEAIIPRSVLLELKKNVTTWGRYGGVGGICLLRTK